SARGTIPTAACIQKPSHPRRENDAARLSFGDGRKAFCSVRNTPEFPQQAVARYVTEWRRSSVVGLWGNRYHRIWRFILFPTTGPGGLSLPSRVPAPKPALGVTG